MFFGGGGFPFGGFDDEDMPGGHPFGGMGGRGGPKKEVDNKRYYELLESDPKDDYDTIRKRYRKLAVRLHPDKPGGDKDKFQEINNAWDTIGDKEKREIYDKYGEEGLKEGRGAGGGGGLFEQMFGMQRPGA